MTHSATDSGLQATSHLPGASAFDAVITWVDGSGEEFQRKRADYAQRLRREDPVLATQSELEFAPPRYIEHGELKFCLRSIFAYAPWIRRIWIVTDDQFPSYFDRSALPEDRISFVSHREIFHGFADVLPVFSSDTIELALWRIEGLSEQFVYFNDDIFLLRPTSPADFFQGDKPVLRGRWADLSNEAVPAWVQRRINSAALLGFDATRIFREAHTPFPLSKAAIEGLLAAHPSLLTRSLFPRFRTRTGYNLVALHNHYCLARDAAVVQSTVDWMAFTKFSNKTDRVKFERAMSGRFVSACFNSLGQFVEAMPECVKMLDRACGPALPFE